ncbi:response regulator [Dendrosporobacter sp. 1207_IL3150]|uniref:response regulator n=1 Tax=Dendrosporobacter sp. 1207_IL3150 TaxID=3084054 RepID=UPI002FD98955
MRILIADDSTLCRLTIKRFLSWNKCYDIAEAANGVEVLEQHRVFKPDLIFMDITMPVLDGISVLRIISKIDKTVKIVIVSSLGNQRFIHAESLKQGAFFTLPKPVNQDSLMQVLDAVQKLANVGGK